MGRMRFQGVANVLRFNWHYYLYALIVAIALFIAGQIFHQPLFYILAAAALGQALASIIISYYVYDLSELYDFNWLDTLEIKDGGELLNIHSGFDESSEQLMEKFSGSQLRVFDFYQARNHTEVSIRRAQKAQTKNSNAIKISTSQIPALDNSVDAGFVIFSAHEIRDDSERIVFFRELRRTLKNSGKIVVTEHVRDVSNVLAYNLGAFHFLTRSEWLATSEGANLRVSKMIKITPFVTTFVLKKDGTAS